MSNLAQLRRALGDLLAACKDDLTVEMAFGLDLAGQVFNLGLAAAPTQRTEANERMADVLDEVDFVVCATNPDVAFPAEIGLNTRVEAGRWAPRTTALTIPASIVGTPPSRSPAGTVDGLPVGMQVIGHHHADAAPRPGAGGGARAPVAARGPVGTGLTRASPPAGPHRATGEVPALCVRER